MLNALPCVSPVFSSPNVLAINLGITMPRTVPLARYLFTRLAQQNVHAVHGVPGDFGLKALDQIRPSGLKWVGNCNELNAGYAADGYARVRGLGALVTTYGVGELSAINAVAGSYAEHVPVVHIVTTPSTKMLREAERRGNVSIHHSLGDSRHGVFSDMAKSVTVAQTRLDNVNTAAESVDEVIQECIHQSRPVYIDIPSDMVNLDVDGTRLESELRENKNSTNNEAVERTAQKLLERIYNAKQPLILVDRGLGLQNMRDEVNSFVKISGIPTLTMPSGAGMVDTSLPNYYGVHSGPVGQIDTLPYLQKSDLVLALGPMFSDTQSLGWTVVPDTDKTIVVGKTSIDGTSVDSRQVILALSELIDSTKISQQDNSLLGNFREIKAQATATQDLIDQTNLYLKLNESGYLQPDDVIILANATPVIGGRDFILPPRARVIASGIWFSIGHMLPAAQGAALAQDKGRTILFEGDGSFQVTAQELSTVIRERLDMTIFMINNSGYAYERQIHGMNEAYNDIAPWNYLEAPRFFGRPGDYPVESYRIETWVDLDKLLDDINFREGKGLKLVDVILGKFDVPEKFEQVFKRAGQLL